MDRAKSMASLLRSEAHGGNWSDTVGGSYLSYAESLCRMIEKIAETADSLESVESSLEGINEFADRDRLEHIKAAVAEAAKNNA